MIRSQKIKGSFTLGPPFYKQMWVFLSLVDYIEIVNKDLSKFLHSFYADIHFLQFVNG